LQLDEEMLRRESTSGDGALLETNATALARINGGEIQ